MWYFVYIVWFCVVKFLIGRLYSDNHTRYPDVMGCCVITFGGSLFMLCVLACYIWLCVLTWQYSVFWRGHLFNSSDRFFLFLCDKPRLLFCFGVVFEDFGAVIIYVCVLACRYLRWVFWRCLTVYFDVVINLISLTDCPLFCVIIFHEFVVCSGVVSCFCAINVPKLKTFVFF